MSLEPVNEMLEVFVICLVSVAAGKLTASFCNVNRQKILQKNLSNSEQVEEEQPEEEVKAADNSDGFDYEEEIHISTFVMPSQPECPICMLPLPFEVDRSVLLPCCGYVLCRACEESSFYGGLKRGIAWDKARKCIFCNCKQVTSMQQFIAALNRLVERGNAKAMYQLGVFYFIGEKSGWNLERDEKRGVELYHMAATAGNPRACQKLGSMYFNGAELGNLVVMKDVKKAMRLFTRGAKLGDPMCLYNLGVLRRQESTEDSVHYFLKSASGGFQLALDEVKRWYLANYITKDEYARALRSFQSSHDEVKSEARTKFNKRLADNQTMYDLSLMTVPEQRMAAATILFRDYSLTSLSIHERSGVLRALGVASFVHM